MTIQFPSQTQKLALNNIGMQLIVRMGEQFYPITHASRFACTTDEILRKTGGFIAHMISDETRTVVATLIASPEPINGLGENVTDLHSASLDYSSLYMRCSEGIFQIAKIIAEDPENTDKDAAETLAISQANHFFRLNQDTALIASSETSDEKEVSTMHFIASNESTLINKKR